MTHGKTTSGQHVTERRLALEEPLGKRILKTSRALRCGSVNEKPNYPIIFGLIILSFFSGWYISERGHTARISDLRNTTEQLNNQNRELNQSLGELKKKLRDFERLIEIQRERIEGLYSDITGGLEQSTDLADGATGDIREAQATVARIRKLLDLP
jgi:hypothetical protein